MNPTETGKAIASLRKKAGFTQLSLAEALGVSDKAVSKWERGLSCPDIGILPKLSILLDTDIDSLLNGSVIAREHHWKGLLVLDEYATATVYTKPLVYFLLSNFMLVGIRDILVVGGNAEALLGSGERYAIRLSYSGDPLGMAIRKHQIGTASGLLMVYGNALVYGSNLTSRYQGLMSLEDGAQQLVSYSGAELPIIFCSSKRWSEIAEASYYWTDAGDIKKTVAPCEKRLGRGVVCLPMTDHRQILEAGTFVRTIEECCHEKIADPDEIAFNRALIRSDPEALK